MMIPKRRLLTLIFACLCFTKSLLIKTYIKFNFCNYGKLQLFSGNFLNSYCPTEVVTPFTKRSEGSDRDYTVTAKITTKKTTTKTAKITTKKTTTKTAKTTTKLVNSLKKKTGIKGKSSLFSS